MFRELAFASRLSSSLVARSSFIRQNVSHSVSSRLVLPRGIGKTRRAFRNFGETIGTIGLAGKRREFRFKRNCRVRRHQLNHRDEEKEKENSLYGYLFDRVHLSMRLSVFCPALASYVRRTKMVVARGIERERTA